MGHDMPIELWPVLLDAIERAARRADAGLGSVKPG
jgi:hypothetical protein